LHLLKNPQRIRFAHAAGILAPIKGVNTDSFSLSTSPPVLHKTKKPYAVSSTKVYHGVSPWSISRSKGTRSALGYVAGISEMQSYLTVGKGIWQERKSRKAKVAVVWDIKQRL